MNIEAAEARSIQHWLGSIPHEQQQVLKVLCEYREAMPIRAIARESELGMEAYPEFLGASGSGK